jgi:hypothetical protein
MQKYLNAVALDYLGPHMLKRFKNDAAKAYIHGRTEDCDVFPLLPHLPEKVENILNIGGGAGVFEPLIFNHLNRPKITLVDKADRLAPDGVTYSLKNLAEDFWRANGIGSEQSRFLTPENYERFACDRHYDVIVSFRALAFLFPYDWYGPFIEKYLRPGGILVIDIKRIGSEFDRGVNQAIHNRFGASPDTAEQVITKLKNAIGPVKHVIYDSPNSTRIVFEREN